MSSVNRNTALLMAYCRRIDKFSLQTVQNLIANGANVKAISPEGKSIMQVLLTNLQFYWIWGTEFNPTATEPDIEELRKIILCLLDHGASLEGLCQAGRVCMSGIWKNDIDAVKTMKEVFLQDDSISVSLVIEIASFLCHKDIQQI